MSRPSHTGAAAGQEREPGGPARRPTGMLARAVVVFLSSWLLAACGPGTVVDDPGPSSGPGTGYQVDVVSPDFDDPPPVVVRLPDGSTHDLEPWSWCLDGGCADGVWPDDPFSVGAPEWVDVTFGVPDWSFEATFTTPRTLAAPPAETRSWRSVAGKVESIGSHTFRVRPAGPSGEWHVDLFGRGPEGGDVIVTFAWRTPVTGDLPDAATGRLSVLAEDDDRLTSYGVELELRDLDVTPTRATARVEVISEDGDRVVLDLGAPGRPHGAGTASWRAGERMGERAVALDGERFTYRVVVVLDGSTHVSTATWPDDTNDEIVPAVPLDFTPPLPVYDG